MSAGILTRKSLFRRDPTPLEIASHELIGAQIALLSAHDALERANAEVSMYRNRIARLRATIRELSTEDEDTESGQGWPA